MAERRLKNFDAVLSKAPNVQSQILVYELRLLISKNISKHQRFVALEQFLRDSWFPPKDFTLKISNDSINNGTTRKLKRFRRKNENLNSCSEVMAEHILNI